jgi:plasmid stabilization system protein ParE
VRAAIEWYLEQGAPAAATAFADRLEHAIQRLAQFLLLGSPGRRNTRSLPLAGFPYSLVYRAEFDTVRIIAVAHQRRRPGYWAGRR